MKPALALILIAGLLAGCDFRGSVNFAVSSGQTLESGGVKFIVPLETSSSMEGDLGFKFDGETVKAQAKDGRLTVNGKDYGQVVAGDTVDLTTPGKVMVNGAERPVVEPVPEIKLQSADTTG